MPLSKSRIPFAFVIPVFLISSCEYFRIATFDSLCTTVIDVSALCQTIQRIEPPKLPLPRKNEQILFNVLAGRRLIERRNLVLSVSDEKANERSHPHSRRAPVPPPPSALLLLAVVDLLRHPLPIATTRAMLVKWTVHGTRRYERSFAFLSRPDAKW